MCLLLWESLDSYFLQAALAPRDLFVARIVASASTETRHPHARQPWCALTLMRIPRNSAPPELDRPKARRPQSATDSPETDQAASLAAISSVLEDFDVVPVPFVLAEGLCSIRLGAASSSPGKWRQLPSKKAPGSIVKRS